LQDRANCSPFRGTAVCRCRACCTILIRKRRRPYTRSFSWRLWPFFWDFSRSRDRWRSVPSSPCLSFVNTSVSQHPLLRVVSFFLHVPITISHRIVVVVGGQAFVPGPFNLGLMVCCISFGSKAWGLTTLTQSGPVAFVASAYMIFMIIVFMFPAIPNPTSHSMNYTAVVLGGTLLLSLGYYFFPRYGGRHWFTGPVETVDRTASNDEKRRSSLET
jgi:hypothetical protein